MRRRSFLQALGASGLSATSAIGVATALGACSTKLKPSPFKADIRVDPKDSISPPLISPLGMSYDAEALNDADWLSPGNTALVDHLRGLSPNFVLRIASAAPPRAPYPAEAPADDETLHRLADFVTAIDARLIFGLPAIKGDLDVCKHQARLLSQRLGPRLMAMQLADEPDLFHDREFDPHRYGFDRFLVDWRQAATELRAAVPNLPIAGPDISEPYGWLDKFGRAVGTDAAFLSGHYFPLGAPKSNSATLSSMIRSQSDDRYVDLRNGIEEAMSTKRPYRLTATNMVNASGKPSISDSFASALWFTKLSIDLFRLGGAGLCAHGGISNASAVFARQNGGVQARAIGMALKLLAAAMPGRFVNCVTQSGNLLFFGAAIRADDGSLKLVLVNQDGLHAVDAVITVGMPIADGHSLKLIAPTVYETEQIYLRAHEARAPNGPLTLTADGALVVVSPASVLLVTLIPA